MSYCVEGKEYSETSEANQKILDDFVQQEVYCNMTSEVNYMLSKLQDAADPNNPFWYYDIDRLFVHYCPKCGGTECFVKMDTEDVDDDLLKTSDDTYECPYCESEYASAEEAKECCGRYRTVYVCKYCGCVMEEGAYEDTTQEAEVFEWWAVSSWLGEHLRRQRCVVIDGRGKSYWGRTTTGQAITLDGCILNILKELEMLEGMEGRPLNNT